MERDRSMLEALDPNDALGLRAELDAQDDLDEAELIRIAASYASDQEFRQWAGRQIAKGDAAKARREAEENLKNANRNR